MTGPSEVDPAVLAGEPDSVHQLERGDDDLPSLAPAPDEEQPDEERPGDEQPDEAPPVAVRDGERWAAADALLEGQPTVLGEQPPSRG